MKTKIQVDEWIGCYRGGWKGVIVDEAFSHPAKVAFNLARRIYEHAIDEKWIVSGDTIVDPFGGIGGCAFHGLMNGMIVVTNELEEKFVNLSKQNRELWRKQYTGLPGFNADNWIILQGDSRKLASVIREAGCCVSSPPYVNSINSDRNGIHWDKIAPDYPGRVETESRKAANDKRHILNYGSAEAQLGAMPEGDLRAAISSPPFPQPYTGGGGINVKGYGDGKDKVGDRTYQSQGGDRTEGNLETLKDGGFDVAISSPPYNPPMSQDHNRSRGGKRGTEPSEQGAFVKYGTSEGQIEGLSMEGFDVAISSPPYVSGGHHPDQTGAWGGAVGTGQPTRNDQSISGYGREDGQMGQMKDAGFDAAISSPPYEKLATGGNDTEKTHERLQLLSEDYGTQGGMFGVDKQHKVKRVSFFRRLHEKRSPETVIEYENVLCFEKPVE